GREQLRKEPPFGLGTAAWRSARSSEKFPERRLNAPNQVVLIYESVQRKVVKFLRTLSTRGLVALLVVVVLLGVGGTAIAIGAGGAGPGPPAEAPAEACDDTVP